jgi:hypothetical protein
LEEIDYQYYRNWLAARTKEQEEKMGKRKASQEKYFRNRKQRLQLYS